MTLSAFFRAILFASGLCIANPVLADPYHTQVRAGERAYTVGNVDAEMQLVEFISYTCPHCATFAVEGEPALQFAYIGSGKLALEIRSFIRNDVDVVATMLVQCGDTDRYWRNHTMLMMTQRTWLPIAQRATQSQLARWSASDGAAARRNIASDLGFYNAMETRGYARPDIDRCLSDQSVADRLEANTKADMEQFGVQSTPSFALNGTLLADVHGWNTLQTALKDQ